MRVTSMFLSVVLAGSLSSAALAQDGDVGADLYASYCAACHGATGLGDGDMANVMTIPSPNLTLLSQANDGEFPMLKVIHIIDGRTGVRAHGGPMPLFGNVFTTPAEGTFPTYDAALTARGRVLSLAMYLESIQK